MLDARLLRRVARVFGGLPGFQGVERHGHNYGTVLIGCPDRRPAGVAGRP
jgi:hypothetical protein